MTTDNTPAKTRDLTPTEQRRVQAVREGGGDDTLWSKRADYVTVVKDDDGNISVEPVLKEELGPKDGPREMAGRMMEATGCTDFLAGTALIARAAEAVAPPKASQEGFAAYVNEVGAAMAELSPRDGIEGMLASQAVTCHQKAMTLLSQAGVQDDAGIAKGLYNVASKMMARSQAALQQLVSYRRGGQQKMIVEHVTVAPGGRAAFVGTLNTGSGEGNQERSRGTL